MAWIELHQTIWSHRKTLMLADALDIQPLYAAAHMIHLWTWALDNAQDGDLTGLPPRVIAAGAGWAGDAAAFIDGAVAAGYIDRVGAGGMELHDWEDYAGLLMDQRRQNAERARRKRQLYDDSSITATVRERDGDDCRYCGREVNWRDRRSPAGGTYDQVDPHRPYTPDNVVVACRGCASTKAGRSLDQAGMVLISSVSTRNLSENCSGSAITVPNRTVPIKTDDDDTAPPASGEDRPGPKPGADPARAECLELINSRRGDWPLAGDRYREFLEFEDRLPWAVIRTAVDKTIAAGARNLSYCTRILERYVEAKVRTVADVEALDAEFEREKQRRARASPSSGGKGGRKSNVILQRDKKDEGYYDHIYHRFGGPDGRAPA